MNEVVKFLNENPVQYLATVGRDGKAKCRPFMFAGEKDGKLWFCTATNKDVYVQLEANPKFEASGWHPGQPWIVVTGEADLEDTVSEATRIAGYEHMTGLGETYEGPNDPRLTFFSVKNGIAKIADIDGSERIIEL